MRFYVLGSAVLLFVFTFTVYLFQWDVSVSPSIVTNLNVPEFNDYKGALNVQSELGEGLSNPYEVIQDAKAAGLDFIFVSDLDPYDKDPNIDGYHGQLLASFEPQYSYVDARYMLLGLPKGERPLSRADSDVLIAGLLSRITKSPNDPVVGMVRAFYKERNWQGDLPSGVDLFEILNPRTQAHRHWRNSKLSSIWSFIAYPLNAKYSFLRLYEEPLDEIAVWDDINITESLVGFAGVDATARAIPLPGYLVKFPSYQKSFEMFTNHVVLKSELTGNFSSDRKKIIEALRSGQNYFSLEMLGSPKGFTFHLEEKQNLYPMGTKIRFNKNQNFVIRLPSTPNFFYEIILYKNGEKKEIFHQPVVRYPVTEPGHYRVSVRVIPPFPIPDGKRWFTWIYTNPIHLY